MITVTLAKLPEPAMPLETIATSGEQVGRPRRVSCELFSRLPDGSR
jgi:hypothetical protein